MTDHSSHDPRRARFERVFRARDDDVRRHAVRMGAADAAAARRAASRAHAIPDRHVVVVPSGTPKDGTAPASLPGPVLKMAATGNGGDPRDMVRRWVDRGARTGGPVPADLCAQDGRPADR